jgi:DNA-binding transcriptional ArsR family regulator
MEKEVDYHGRLRILRDYDVEEMNKLKDIFIAFSSESMQSLLKLLAQRMLVGQDWMRCKDILAHILEHEKHSFSRISINLRRMEQMGIILKKKTKGQVSYKLSPMFEQVSKIFFWVLNDKLPEKYDERLQVFVQMPQKDLKILRLSFIQFGSESAQQVLKYLATDFLKGTTMIWRNDMKQNIMDAFGFDQPRISSNISRLLKAGLLKREKKGKYVYYGLSEVFREITKIFPLLADYLPKVENTDRLTRSKKAKNYKNK